MQARRRIARVLTALVIFAGFTPAGFARAADPIVLRYAGNFPIKHFMTQMMQDWAKLVEQRSGNRVKMEIYPAGQLYSDKDLGRALSSGAVDFGQAMNNVLSGISPAGELLAFSMMYDDWDHFDRVMHKRGGFQILDEEARTHNMKEVFIMPYGTTMGPILGKKRITQHAELKGLKIRAMGGTAAKTLEALGATPVFLGSGEVYQALQRGTIDGAVSGPTSMTERAWGEVTKYLWMLHICPSTAGHTVANLNSWNKLPPDIQKIMLDTGREIELKYRNGIVAKEEAEAFATLKKAGVEFVYPSAQELAEARRLVTPVIDEWAKKSKWCKQIVDIAAQERGKK